MAWTDQQWTAAENAYTRARLAALNCATALQQLSDEERDRIQDVVGGRAAAVHTITAASALTDEWPSSHTRATERTATTLIRAARRWRMAFARVDRLLRDAHQTNVHDAADAIARLDDLGWAQARSQMAAIRWQRVPNPSSSARSLTSTSDEPPSSSTNDEARADAPSSTTNTTARRRRRTKVPWLLLGAIAVWLWSRKR